MGQMNAQCKIVDCTVGLLERVLYARRQVLFEIFKPVFGHGLTIGGTRHNPIFRQGMTSLGEKYASVTWGVLSQINEPLLLET